ncbi:hypothetical protein B0H14DRAFT_3459091 [Mycena olivaceomarginata]|nr:hypothetical protein B0H14DRAFT_3459091 [Mycena olivaceomarginata]
MHAVFVGTRLNPPVTFVGTRTHLLVALFHTRTQPPIAFVRVRTHPLVAIVGRESRPHVTWIITRPHLCPLAGPHSPPRRCVFVGTQLHPPVAIVRTRTHPLVAIVRTGARLPVVFVDALPHPLVVFPHLCVVAGPHSPPRLCVSVGTQLHPLVTVVGTRTHLTVTFVGTRTHPRIIFVGALPHPLVVFVGRLYPARRFVDPSSPRMSS